jgi:plastocyanin
MRPAYAKRGAAARARILAGALLLLGATGAGAADAQRVELRVELRDAAGQPAPGTVVWLQGATPERLAPGAARAAVDQRDKAFVPGWLVVQTGTTVEFPNHDSVSHQVYSFSGANSFELPLYKGDQPRPVVFQHAGVVTLGCNIHDRMLGYLVVVDTPHFGVTAADGTASLAGVRPGHYQAWAWSLRLDAEKPVAIGGVDVAAGAPLALRLDRRLRSPAAERRTGLSWGDY